MRKRYIRRDVILFVAFQLGVWTNYLSCKTDAGARREDTAGEVSLNKLFSNLFRVNNIVRYFRAHLV